MAANAPETLLTAEEFYELPEPERACRMELVDGRVIMTPPPGAGHGMQSNAITVPLTLFVRQHRLGVVLPEVGFRLRVDPDVVRAPDTAFLAGERIPAGGLGAGYPAGGPTLAVEVVSPSDSPGRILEKVRDYLDAGAQRVWVVRPATQSVTVYFADGDVTTLRRGETLTSAHAGFAVDGFALPVDEIFA